MGTYIVNTKYTHADVLHNKLFTPFLYTVRNETCTTQNSPMGYVNDKIRTFQLRTSPSTLIVIIAQLYTCRVTRVT